MSLTALIVTIASLIGAGGAGGLIKTWLDHKRGKRAQTDQVALELVERLERRVEKLERSLDEERERCESEMRMLRHRIGGWKQLFYSLLHLFDLPDRQRRETLEKIRAQMAELEKVEAAETGAMLGARMKGSE